MRIHNLLLTCLGLITLLGCSEAISPQSVQAASPGSQRNDIYDEKADAKAVIAKAVAQAKKENKQVLITWGGDWCGWCHTLDGVLKNNATLKTSLEKNYVRVMVDTRSNRELMKEMKVKAPTVPYLTILDGNGNKVIDQEMGKMIKGSSFNPTLLLAYLNKYKVKPAQVKVAAAPKKIRKDIYDVKADAKAVIAKAVKQAKKENKHVLITWGGNWCGWCHLLHGTFENNKEIKADLKKHFVRVTVDTRTNKALMKEMKVHTKGVPYLTVLDGNGKKVMDQATGPLEKGRVHDPKKVLAFLKKARPKNIPAPSTSTSTNAESTLSKALANLNRDDQRLFVKFSTQSCGWCKRLNAFLQDESIAPILAKDFAFVEMDQVKLPGASELRKRLSAGKPSGGVPWFAILDKNGNVLSTATGKSGNIGYPAEPEGIVHFMNMLNSSATTISDTEFDTVETELKTLGKKFGY